MLDRVSFRKGDPRILHFPVAAGTTQVINPGSLLFWDAEDGVVKPASEFTWNTSIGVTAPEFAAVFVGVAMGKVDPLDRAGTIPVATDGICEFVSASATYGPGDALRAKKQADANALEDVTIEAGDDSSAIAFVVEPAASATAVHAILNVKLFKDSPRVSIADHIADPTGGSTEDAEARAAIVAILAALENEGIVASA